MADTSTLTQYEITGQIGDDSFNVMLLDPKMTDAGALAIAQALRAVDLPQGMTRSVSIFKNVTVATSSTANIADDQPVFA
jgi:hypothetical protein